MITMPIKQEIIDLTDDLDDTNVPMNTSMHIVPVTNYGVGSCFLDIQESPMKKMKLETETFVSNPGKNEGACHDQTVGMDHVRVHPKFLHSNATSHKWALGAFAELLDNAMDEVCNGATYVSVDVLDNKKDVGSKMLVEDNGGGMTPDKMHQCMSLGYSAKSKLANTIG
ncbi:hypothetical protein CQW23_24623 [Capsicum baccatum]|uniref:Histidine kinase/HSP90-like ATPase domain-containing protein n=1 Tax=Capsicum baccatum TaxID=33114 RepID=A0A2G2VVF7_CAPBA|nr:hypothetical protein CQW23_24623 [Capsicum baccatum]